MNQGSENAIVQLNKKEPEQKLTQLKQQE